ncbi:Uncharacterized protein SCF082_LOCUS8092 [Durusdinium trenchii]|uniref:Uncharacterized protein n=1 Tax=Durusdinium trenchii TaxID=1381693 RepID=A0ABP0INS3_9DINO
MEAPIPLTRHSEALRDLALQLQAPSEEMQGEMEDLAQRLTEAFAAAKRKLRQLQRAKAQKKEHFEELSRRASDASEALRTALAEAAELLAELQELGQLGELQRQKERGRTVLAGIPILSKISAWRQVGRNAQVAARIIGFVREVRTSDARPEMEMDPMPLTGTEVPELANDRCILNDEGLTLLCGAKVLCSLSLPLVQLCVIVAAQVYLGRPAWEAAMLSFQERSWEHYFESLGHFAKQRPLTLLWVYL